MKIRIENDILAVESKTAGAELTSIRLKSDGTEYLWQGDPKHWARQSPLLFPIVGAVANNQYTFAGKTYAMKNHGFVRDTDFEITHESADAVRYTLSSGAATLAAYPFRFRLAVGYMLKGSAVIVSWDVVNEGEDPMWFSIGAHPAFNCPIAAGDAFTDYYLEFNETERIDRQFVNAANLLIAGRREPFLRNERVKPVAEGMFDEGAYVLDGFKSTSVALKGRKTDKAVTVSFPGFHELGIWAPPGAPFVCIEPWHGISEATDFAGDLTQKASVIQLAGGQTHTSEYRIIIA